MKFKDNKMLDLFAGCGGLTLGFVQNGFEIMDTIEIWKPAVETYNFNFHLDTESRDITDISVRKEVIKKCKNKINLIIGGFPCQGFSLAGKRSIYDPRNKLYEYVIGFISSLKPKVFVLENVKGILSYKEKDGELVVNKIKQKIQDIGYYIDYVLLDTSNFLVPQKRERVIFIGSKNKKKVEMCIKKLKEHKDKVLTVYDAIYDLENKEEDLSFNHIFTNHSEDMINKIAKTKIGESAMKNFSDAFRRIDYFKPSPTVKENHGGVHLHPSQNRVLTPRELARLQTFPDTFIFKSNKSNILKQIGNAVPVNFAKQIAAYVKKIFF